VSSVFSLFSFFFLLLYSSSSKLFPLWAEPPLSPPFHPHSWLSDGRSVQVGCPRFSRCCYLHLFEQCDVRVALLGDFLHAHLVFLDALVQRFDFLEQWLQNIPQLRLPSRGQLPVHLLRTTLGQPLPMRLHQPSRCVHQGGSCPHQFGPRSNHRQMNLGLRAAMPHRPQQLGIDARQPGQCPRIVSIIFASALGDQLHLLCVRHQHLVSQLPEQPAFDYCTSSNSPGFQLLSNHDCNGP
jgi:hypothetical protein